MVEGAVAAFTFAPVAFALTLVLALVLMLVLTFASLEHALAARATTAIAKRRMKTGRLTSVFFIVALSESFALARDVVISAGAIKGAGKVKKNSTSWATPKPWYFDLGSLCFATG